MVLALPLNRWPTFISGSWNKSEPGLCCVGLRIAQDSAAQVWFCICGNKMVYTIRLCMQDRHKEGKQTSAVSALYQPSSLCESAEASSYFPPVVFSLTTVLPDPDPQIYHLWDKKTKAQLFSAVYWCFEGDNTLTTTSPSEISPFLRD